MHTLVEVRFTSKSKGPCRRLRPFSQSCNVRTLTPNFGKSGIITIDKLLEASEALNGEFNRVFEFGLYNDSPRVRASWIMCSVALEHSVGLRQLMVLGNYTTAIYVMRSQFEAVTRAMWLFYAASDDKISNTMAELSVLSQNADQKPNNSDMMKALEGKAPEKGMTMLRDFRDCQWKALNSYVYCGGCEYRISKQDSNYFVFAMGFEIIK
jgi:hypothetical protein